MERDRYRLTTGITARKLRRGRKKHPEEMFHD